MHDYRRETYSSLTHCNRQTYSLDGTPSINSNNWRLKRLPITGSTTMNSDHFDTKFQTYLAGNFVNIGPFSTNFEPIESP